MGVGYEVQLLDSIPVDQGDVALDWIITEEMYREFGCSRVSKSGG